MLRNQRSRHNDGPRGGAERDKEFKEKVIEVSRVARVVAGGKRFRFRATVVVGDSKGRVGMAIAKADDVTNAVTKAVSHAKNHLIRVPLVHGTIPHEVDARWDRAVVLLKPAKPGTGVIAGGVVRAVMELVGVTDAVSKMLGTQNKINNLRATFKALSMLRDPESLKSMRVVKTIQSPQYINH
ncbi:MAG: 30S ribosomal protein S5 [Parcubacteria group bacterium]|nr:30S ribosomal protein S5 [Parcubacteria group bacterium]